MKLLQKRILIMFSVALNIGFLITAMTMAYQQPKALRESPRTEIAGIVYRLELSQTEEKVVLDVIQRFGVAMDQYDQDVRQARDEIIVFLSQTGPVAPEQLNLLIKDATHQEKRRNEAFEAHVLELRALLGQEKGARFFGLLLEDLQTRKRLHR